MSLSDDEIRDIVIGTLSGANESIRKRYTHEMGPYDIEQLNVGTILIARAVERAARAQVWREAAEVCDGFDVCDPQHIAREFRARAEKEQG